MRTLVKMKFGSDLYGTRTPSSDTDYKSVFIPGGRVIVMQQIRETMRLTVRDGVVIDKARDEKNQPGDVDWEAFALHKFLKLVAEGQTIAMDILFAPHQMFVGDIDDIWFDILAHRHQLVSRKAAGFVNYCRTQANKYGIKGSRISALREVLLWFSDMIATYGGLSRLMNAATEHDLARYIANIEHTSITEIQSRSNEPIKHLVCCDRMAPYTISLKDARAIFQRTLDSYGTRALQAERDEGVDWKALSHAVRVGGEALELLTTGHITFPRPDADELIAIKTGQRHYKGVAEIIEQLLVDVETAQATSNLPDDVDHAFINDFVFRNYQHMVRYTR